jgi:hypothetical protein
MTTKTVKFPSIARRPNGLTEKLEAAIEKSARDITADGVKALILGEKGKEKKLAKAWFKDKTMDKMWVWWVLERRDLKERAEKELGVEAGPSPEETLNLAMAALRKRYVYGAYRNEVFDKNARDWIKIDALDNLESINMPVDEKGRKHKAFDLLRSDKFSSRVHNERFLPGFEEEIVEQDGVNWLNTWVKPDVVPTPGDASVMTNHILYLCNGIQEYADHLLDWLAYAYQNPGKKIMHAPLIISGEHGVGKDSLAKAFVRVIGSENGLEIKNETLEGNRFHFMKASLFVYIGEIMTGDRRDIANKLKPLITSEKVEIDEKNIRPYWVPNTTNLMFFSNHENAAHIEDNDRRYYVIICQQKPESEEYYNRLHNFIEGDEVAHFAHFLKERDVSSFNPSARPPETEYKQTVQRATRGGVEAWLDEALESQQEPFSTDVINTIDCLRMISDMKGPRMTIGQLTNFIKKSGGKEIGKRRVDGSQVRLWAVRNADKIIDGLNDGTISLSKEMGLYTAHGVTDEKVVSIDRMKA